MDAAKTKVTPQRTAAVRQSVLLVSWTLWKERNSRTFQGVASRIEIIYKAMVEEAEDWVQAGFSSLAVVVATFVCYVTSAL